MLRYLSRLARVGLVIALGFGGGVGLLIFIYLLINVGNREAFPYAFQTGLRVGLIFALLLLAAMVIGDLSARTYLAKGISDTFWDLEQERNVVLEGSFKQITAACRQALLSVPQVTNVFDDLENRCLRASTGASWRSHGEDLEIKIEPINETQWRVHCSSHSKSKSVVFDYGKNFENVEVWNKQLHKEMNSQEKTT